MALLVATLLGVFEPLLFDLLFWRQGLSSGSSLALTIRVVSIVLVIRGTVPVGFLNPEVAVEVTDLVVVLVTLVIGADFCFISASKRMNSATSAPSAVLDASLIFFLGLDGVAVRLMLDELVVLLTGRADFLLVMFVDGPVERLLLEVTEDDVIVVLLRLEDDALLGRLILDELAGELRIWPESDRLVTLALLVLVGVDDDVMVLRLVLLDDDVILRVFTDDGSGA